MINNNLNSKEIRSHNNNIINIFLTILNGNKILNIINNSIKKLQRLHVTKDLNILCL